jgi:hypothetical protein
LQDVSRKNRWTSAGDDGFHLLEQFDRFAAILFAAFFPDGSQVER